MQNTQKTQNSVQFTIWVRSTRSRPICGGISALSQCAFLIDRSLSLCKWRETRFNTDVFSFVFMSSHQQKRLVLRVMSSSRNQTFTNRSVLMPRFYICETTSPAFSHGPDTGTPCNSTKRSLHIANAFLKQIGSCVVENKRYPKRASEKRIRAWTLRLITRQNIILSIIHQLKQSL